MGTSLCYLSSQKSTNTKMSLSTDEVASRLPQTSRLNDDLSLRPPLVSPTPDGHDEAIEPMVRRMLLASHALGLGVATRFTAIVLWHRYFAAVSRDQKESPASASTASVNSDGMAWAAAACLFLACKVEETPRQLRDIINVAQMLLKEQQQSTVQSDTAWPVSSASTSLTAENKVNNTDNSERPPSEMSSGLVRATRRNPPTLDDVTYWDTKRNILRSEQIVLRWLGFDFAVSKPHRAVVELVKDPKISELLLQRVSESQIGQLQTVAWRRLNEALFYSPALQHSSMELACAAVLLAVDEVGSATNPSTDEERSDSWWKLVEVSDSSIERTIEDLRLATAKSERDKQTTNI